ncbi:MAG: 1-deoxy-D-xylulose-5-phosphate reductoisomerase [Actinobacteria bacterium]|nr:1-deoxy-D-xylulose-5-phosphate reductoisomerase [Actinomycetota bacterium]
MAEPSGVVVLGSTGSVGSNALDVIGRLPDRFRLIGLGACSQWQRLAEQANQFRPAAVAVYNPDAAEKLSKALNGSGSKILSGSEGMTELVTHADCQKVLAASSGTSTLAAILAAIKAGKTIALANKELLVMAGAIAMPLAKEHQATIIPVDSEHSAIFQAAQCGKRSEIRKVFITASGGPFRNGSIEQMAKANVQEALAHPTWSMGPKVTIDSATMMNKALEIIEAHWLFDLPADMIEVVIHPESIIHSMVEFRDGSVLAQMSPPDMRSPIQYALTFPERLAGCTPRLDVGHLASMSFHPPDYKRFPAIELGYQVAKTGGTSGAVLNAANEALVEAFLDKRIRLTDIPVMAKTILDHHSLISDPDLSDILTAADWAVNEVHKCIG